MIGWLYTAILLAIVTFVLLRGGMDERVIVITLLVGSVSTRFIYRYFGRDFAAIPLPMLINESAVLAVILAVAFRSKRFWPLSVAAFEVAAFLALLTPFFGENILSRGLGRAQGIWAYLQLLVLIVATIRHRRNPPSTPANSSPN